MKLDSKNWKYIAYALVGVILLIMVLVTGTNGLPKVDQEIYSDALKLEERVNGFGFEDFAISNYKVRFFDGTIDYVVKGDSIEKEEAAFQTFVGTTVEIDGEYQVLLPTYDRFEQMFSALSTVGSMAEGSSSFEETDYSTNAHMATLWHEAFHTWQFARQASQLLEMAEEAGIGEETKYAEVLKNEVDSNNALVLSFEKEMQLLTQAYEENDIMKKCEILQQIFTLQEERKELLSKQAVFIEQYYEMVEGSAKYVEGCAFKELEGQEAWESTYMGPFEYENGSGKYYTSGMMKCLILDQIAPDWKATFDVTISLDVLLQQAMDVLLK